jgi:hypothetical protein
MFERRGVLVLVYVETAILLGSLELKPRMLCRIGEARSGGWNEEDDGERK